MWAGRSNAPLDPQFEQWQRSFPYDKRLLPYEIAASKAHARALHGVRVLDDAELAATLDGLDRIAKAGVPEADLPGIEDVHHYVEVKLVEFIGEVGYKLHTGRSRNEQIATDLRLFVRDAIAAGCASLATLLRALLARARVAGDAAMPAYTHLRRAEPVLVAHWLLAYVEMFLRDAGRLQDCLARVNQCPLGSGAIAGTILPLDRAAMAKELGFFAPTANSIDATSDRDFVIEYVQALSTLALHLSRLAEELIIFSTQEFGFIQLPEAFSTGSSAMPQKLNPDALELLRGSSGRIFGSLVQMLTTVKGLPLAYNKDLQELQRPLFDAADLSGDLLAIAVGCVSGMVIHHDATDRAATTGGMNALAAAAWMVKRSVPFRRAHEAVGKAVRLCLEKSCELQELPAVTLKECGIDADASFFDALTLSAVLDCHDVAGGTNRARVEAALLAAQEEVDRLDPEHASGGEPGKRGAHARA